MFSSNVTVVRGIEGTGDGSRSDDIPKKSDCQVVVHPPETQDLELVCMCDESSPSSSSGLCPP